MAVSKYHAAERVGEAHAAGQTLFGENRVQEAATKIPQCSNSCHWHLIGHLQSNKVKLAVSLFETIHSVDSLKLLDRINSEAGEQGRTIEVLLQVNVSGEASKFGLKPEELGPILQEATRFMNVDVVGLMTIPPAADDIEKTRVHFVALRELRDRLAEESGFPLLELSMGMSHDFSVAVEEGATYIRIGTDIFGKRSYT